MVSKNNQWQHLRASAQRVPHYGLRKLSVGVASVLLSTTLYMGVSAHADTVATPGETTNPARVTGVNSSVGDAVGSSASGVPVSQASSANPSTTPAKPAASTAGVKPGSGTPVQPATGVAATSDNKQAATAAPVTPRLKLLASQPVTENPDISDVNVDLTNYWKQPADMSKATSAGGHTEWLNNGPNYVNAKVTDFKATMYADNATLSTKDWYRIGYQIGFDVDATNLQPGKILHLFRLTQTSDTGYLPMLSSDNSDVPVQWNGKNLGTIHTSFHNIKTRGSDNLIDYFDINLEITAKLDGVGNQHITLNVPWNNIINYYRPYSWRGAPELNKVTLVVTNNDFKYTKQSTWQLGHTEYSPMTIKDNWGETSYLPVDIPAQFATFGTANIWFSQHPLVYVDTDTAKAFYDSGAKMPLTIADDTRVRGGYHIYSTNGNKLVLDRNVGDTTPLRPGRVEYPIVLPDGTVTLQNQGYDNWNSSYSMPGANLGLAEIVNQNLTLSELKALNKTGLVVSAQDDGSINAYLNLPVAGMRQYDTPANRQQMYNQLINNSVEVNYSKYAANPTELKQLLKNTVDYYFNGPTKGLPLVFGVSIPINYHLANLTEPTKINADSIEDQSLATGAVVERRTNTYTPNLAKIAGQSAVRFHYVSGFNGAEIQAGDTAVGKPDGPVELPTFPTIKGYTRRIINAAGTAIKLGNGTTMNLPADSQVLVDGQALNFGAESTWHDYYVVYDPVSVTKTYRFVDDTNDDPVGSDIRVTGSYQQTVKTGLVVPTGYKLAANQTLSTQVTLNVDDPGVTLIHLIHQTTTVTPTDPKANGTPLPDNPNLTFNGVTAADLTKTVIRTIKYIDDTPGGPGWFDTTKQEAHLTRIADVDEVTGVVKYGDWTTGQWDAYIPEVIPGYTPSMNEVPKVNVDGSSSDQLVAVTYTPNPQTVVITFMDQSGNQIGTSVTVAGRIGETVNVNDQVPDGWKLYAGQAVPKTITLSLGTTKYDLVVKHLQSFVSFDQPKETTDLINGTRNIHYPNGLTKDDLTKTVTRIIKDGDRVVKTQSVTFVRNAVVNVVTGQVTYLNWSYNGQYLFAAYVPTPKNGYTVDLVKSLVVTPESKFSVVDLAYHPVAKTITVNYVDESGKVIQSVTGVTKLTAPAGYRLLTSDPIKVGDLAVNTYTVLVVPVRKTYTVHDQLPANVKDLSKVVTRTIKIEMPNGHVRIVKQQVKFERTATVNANGTVTYSEYHAIGRNSFNKVFIPHRSGYKLIFSDGSKGVAKVDNVNADTSDIAIVVKYVK